jgi:hypothetical protein
MKSDILALAVATLCVLSLVFMFGYALDKQAQWYEDNSLNHDRVSSFK